MQVNGNRHVDLNQFYSDLINEKKFDLYDLKKLAEHKYNSDSNPVQVYNEITKALFSERLKPFYLLLQGQKEKNSILSWLPRELIYVITQSLGIEKPPLFSNAFDGKLLSKGTRKNARTSNLLLYRE